MTQGANASAIAGIQTEENQPTVAELQARIRALENEKKDRDAAQLIDQHRTSANESRSKDKERFAILIDEAREQGEIDPVPVSINGRMYQIKRGKVVEVPEEVIDVLRNAIEERPIVRLDANGNPNGYEGWRKARRFPFQNFGKTVDATGERTNPQPNIPVTETML